RAVFRREMSPDPAVDGDQCGSEHGSDQAGGYGFSQSGGANEDGGHREQQTESERVSAAHVEGGHVLGGENDNCDGPRQPAGSRKQERNRNREDQSRGATEIRTHRFAFTNSAESIAGEADHRKFQPNRERMP